MAQGTPENLESRCQRAQELAQRSKDRMLFYMGLTGAGLVGMVADIIYINQKYFPVTNTMEEIQQGQVDSTTQAALTAGIGVVAFELFCAASVLAAGYKVYQHHKYNREATKILKEMENRSKRPPTLGS